MKNKTFLPIDQVVFTTEGCRPVGELVTDESFSNATGDFVSPSPLITSVGPTTEVDCVKILTKELAEIVLPLDTLVGTTRGRIKARDLTIDDEILTFISDPLVLPEPKKGSWESFWATQGRLAGWLIGDGTFRNSTRQNKNGTSVRVSQMVLYFCTEKDVDIDPTCQELADLLQVKCHSYFQNKGKSKVSTLGIPKHFFEQQFSCKEELEIYIQKKDNHFLQQYLRSFFSADGTIGSGPSSNTVRLSQSNLPRLQRVRILLARFGIFSKIYRNGKPGIYTWWEKDEVTGERVAVRQGPKKAPYNLVIDGIHCHTFREVIGFDHAKKTAELDVLCAKKVNFLNRTQANIVAEIEHIKAPCREIEVELAQGAPAAQIALNGFKVYI